MKKILKYLKEYWDNSYSIKTHLFFLFFTGALIAINYWLDFEDVYIDAYYGSELRILWYFLIQFIPYLICLLIISDVRKEGFWKDKTLWLKWIVGFAILGFDRSFYYYRILIEGVDQDIYIWLFRTLNAASGLLSNVFLLFLFYLIFDKKYVGSFYGFRFDNINYKAYAGLFAIMVPIVLAGSFLPDFIEYYPKYKKTMGHLFSNYYEIPEYLALIGYEFSYLSDFISIELFFRGFLIIGLAPHLGKHVVLPMACSYAVLHFGKPMGECISSIFGGYVLGVIALYSRNIWGGVVLHMGIAALMEFFAFLQIYFRS